MKKILLIEKDITHNDKYPFAINKDILWNGVDNFITYCKEDSNIGFYYIVSSRGIRKDFKVEDIRDYGTGIIAVAFHRLFEIHSVLYDTCFSKTENSYLIGIEYCVPKFHKIYKNLQVLINTNLKIKQRINDGLKTKKIIGNIVLYNQR